MRRNAATLRPALRPLIGLFHLGLQPYDALALRAGVFFEAPKRRLRLGFHALDLAQLGQRARALLAGLARFELQLACGK